MLNIKQLLLLSTVTFFIQGCNKEAQSNFDDNELKAISLLSNMSLTEKIAQKIILDFRYWCTDAQPDCTKSLTHINNNVTQIIQDYPIGGVILFSNNLVDTAQTTRFIHDLQASVNNNQTLGLLITLDQEGDNVVRLSRLHSTNMPGNMALGAAYLSQHNNNLAYEVGQVLAEEVKAVGVNVNFSPVVDVQTNSLNPVINGRAFGEKPHMVSLLGGQMASGMSDSHVIATFKHFPGHGDTDVDSHFGLPIVKRTKQEAYQYDLEPYRQAITQGYAPDMIMTAHIQYPCLDNSTVITSKTQESMIVPATLSRKIQQDILRDEMGFTGLTITDALDMKGISEFFTPSDAVIKTFQAGVDIALMPINIRTASGSQQLQTLIDNVEYAILNGDINMNDIDQSVLRILKTKFKHNILHQTKTTDIEDKIIIAKAIIGSEQHKAIEQDITQKSITLIKNVKLLPLRSESQLGHIHILTPWDEQGEAMQRRFNELGIEHVSHQKLSNTSWKNEKKNIDNADTIIVATLSNAPSPVEKNGDLDDTTQPNNVMINKKAPMNIIGSLVFNEDIPYTAASSNIKQNKINSQDAQISDQQFARYALEEATKQGKQTILLSLRAPYDVVHFDDVAQAVLASYNYYGYANGGLRSLSMPAIVDVIMGLYAPVGRLPVTIHEQNDQGELGNIAYPYGFGLSY
ncbi:glycoside hydrolase family 3 protein [Shewanella surugensis]|uniref:beta-N-acetylhexosaminidase n=1 Tax=Shewanella surugensis TaxID=212020 RepID=A0ABT0LG78_9GAMM|nr:glycoside hydrolase family 3 protein [Shewanella surugensis]MCL1126579.1 glycoside hydrolase family 3 protein [Shewanella surugensis]